MEEFEDFYAASYSALFRVLVTFTTDRQDAEDVLQEAYARAASDWRRVSQLDNPAAWVRRVAMNRAVDGHRRRSRRRAAYARLEATTVATPALDVDVQTALRGLRLEEREAVVLHHLLGLTVAEIAADTGRPTGTIKAQLVRGRQQLADQLRISLEDVR